nr:Rne/Rng family ribonuclease [Granulosicoccus antarcticus]
MLINATHSEELRVAIVDGQRLVDLDIEHKSREQRKSNIYKAKITRVEPSLEAVFVDYGADRHGFLPFKEIAKEFLNGSNKKTEGGRPSIRDCIKEGQEIVVQIEKEERSNKGAALTTFISLAGRFLVLMPNNPRAGGVSRRIEGDDRSELKAAMSDVEVPAGMGTIVRTAGIGRTTEELQWDLDYQAAIWKAIQEAAGENKAPFLIYQESNIIVRGLRDYFRGDIGEIIADEATTYEQAAEFIRLYMPQNERKLKMYQDDVPLFNRYQVESQIESAFRREVRLPSGGALVIDHTEALVSIDINSARATKGSDIEETATNTNLEAADEVARQLRLRDLGGLVVIDFIDMMDSKHQRAVENRLRDALKQDRARVQIGRISKFGLLEMSRQRLRPSLGESSENVCPRCQGHGTIRGIESTALSILRLVEEDAMKDNTGRVMADVPVEVATYLLNEKRQSITEIEARNNVVLLIVANPTLETPNYTIERIRMSEADHDMVTKKSYELASDNTETYSAQQEAREEKKPETAAVSAVSPLAPAPTPARLQQQAVVPGPVQGPGGFRRILGAVTSLFGASSSSNESSADSTTEQNASGSKSANTNARRNGNSDDESRGQKRGSRSGNRNGRGRSKQADGENGENGENGETSNESPRGGRNNQRRAKNAEAPEGERKNPRGRGRGRKQENSANAEELPIAVDGEGEATDANAGKPENNKRSANGRRSKRKVEQTTPENSDTVVIDAESAPTTTADGPANEQPANSEEGGRTRGRRGGRRRGGRGRGKTNERDENGEIKESAANDADATVEPSANATGEHQQADNADAKGNNAEAVSIDDASAAMSESTEKAESVGEKAAITTATAVVDAPNEVIASSEEPANDTSAESTSETSETSETSDTSEASPTDRQKSSRQKGRRRSSKAAANDTAEDASAAEVVETAPAEPAAIESAEEPALVESVEAQPAAVVSAEEPAPVESAEAQPATVEPVEEPAATESAEAKPAALEPVEEPAPVESAEAQAAAVEPAEEPAPVESAEAQAAAVEPAEVPAPVETAEAKPAVIESAEEPAAVEPAEATEAEPAAISELDSEDPSDDSDDTGKPKRRGGGRRRERVNSKKAAAAKSPTPAETADSNDTTTTAEESTKPEKHQPEPADISPVETSASEATTHVVTEESKVSQRQPSQLKSSVRSLANKDESGSGGGLSLASKRVPDVIPASLGSKAVEVGNSEAATKAAVNDNTSQSSDEAIESNVKPTTEKLND